MEVIKKDDYRIPVFSWCPDLEYEARQQVDNAARLPFVEGQIVVLSDAHKGYGVTIGTVLACNDVVIPNAVGVN